MEYCITGSGSKLVDKWCIEKMGIPSIVLMERAALAVCDEVYNEIGKDIDLGADRARVLIFCGSGNNGADGLAAGRILMNQGIEVCLYIAGNLHKASEEFKIQYNILKNMKAWMVLLDEHSIEEIQFRKGDIIIDAVFGIGLSRAVAGNQKKIIDKMNQAENRVISVDIPSGLCGDRGVVMGCCVVADKTVTFGKLKAGLILCDGKDYAGEVVIKDVGFLKEAYQADDVGEDNSICRDKDNSSIKNEQYLFYEKEDLRQIPDRKKSSHKGTYGTVTVIAGSEKMSGAAVLCAKSVYRCGAGIVRVLTHKDCMNIIRNSIYEAIVNDYDEDMHITEKDIVVIGSGLSVSERSKTLVTKVLRSGCKAVVDADALNLISSDRELLYELHEEIVITPHIKEMARLCGRESYEIREHIVETAREFAGKYHCVTVIKDATTVIADKCGEIYVNRSGNSGMSTGGSGDVLAGIIGGMLSQKLSVYQSACMGVYLHGMAGDIARDKMTAYGMVATDIIDAIPEVLKLR